jgi:hypothetical protein
LYATSFIDQRQEEIQQERQTIMEEVSPIQLDDDDNEEEGPSKKSSRRFGVKEQARVTQAHKLRSQDVCQQSGR